MRTAHYQDFPSKLLLFGEYGLMYGSKALSVPYNNFHGSFRSDFSLVNNQSAEQSNEHLKIYFQYLKDKFRSGRFIDLDLDRLDRDISAGLYFDSNIPQGYGLGSSGALVAALVSKYGILNKRADNEEMDLQAYKTFFSKMESYFHGKSSGLDPLISFLNKAILTNPPSEISTIELPAFNSNGKGAMFLIDSGSPGETQPLVDYFIERCKNKSFLDLISNSFRTLTNNCVLSYLNMEKDSLFKNVNVLSAFQLEHFKKMIPESIYNVWIKGLKSGDYSLKLCGSGGGGMTLGFTADYEKCGTDLQSFKMQIVHRI